MSTVAAHTKPCDPRNEGTPDNANTSTPASENPDIPEENDLKFSSENAAPIDPGALAARILQLSAANTAAQTPPKKPRVLWQDDTPLEVPEVLAQPGSSRSCRETRRNRHRQNRGAPGSGPTFTALLISTILIGFAGGGAVALGLPDLMAGDEPPVKKVLTQTISPEEIVAGGTASPVAVAKAKDRIRQAFSETRQQDQIPPASGDPAIAMVTSAQTATTAAGSTWIKLAGTDDPQTTATTPEKPASVSSNAIAPVISPAPGSPAAVSTRPMALSPATDTRQANADEVHGSSALQETPGPDLQEPPYPNTGITTDSVNMRESDDKDAEIVAVLPEGTEVRYSDCSKWWCNVAHGGKSGYVGQKFLARD